MNPPRPAVAVIGMSGRFPGAATLAQFWENLCGGVESINRFTPEELIASGVPPEVARDPAYIPAKGILDDIAAFDREFFGYSPREAAMMDPQHRIFLECVWEALEHAGCDPLTAPGAIGLWAGCGDASYLHHLIGQSPNPAEAAREYSNFFGNYRDFFATRVAYRLNLRGPCVGVQTACSTSLVAVNMAWSALLNYQCDVAVAGGIHVSVPHKSGNFHEAGAVVSPDGHCRPFDADARGTVASDGAGVVILKRLDEALEDGDTIHAVILGGAINNDGSAKIGFTAPGVEGQAEVIAMAQELAGVSPEAVTYVETHGTGTSLGDPIEVKALTRAFQRGTAQPGSCAIGSLKGNIGHLDAAAGVAGLIKTILCLKHGVIPPSVNFNRPNPEIDFAHSPFFVCDRLREWRVGDGMRIAGVSSFGIGGTNAHTIVEEAPAAVDARSGKPAHLFVLSARSDAALERAAANLATHLEAHPDLDPGSVAHTLQAGRHAFAHRMAFPAGGLEKAVTALRAPGKTHRGVVGDKRRAVAFLFPGQGLQAVDMGRALYESAPLFREQVNAGAALAREFLGGIDLLPLLYPDGQQPRATVLDETRFAQPALFVVEYALARYFEALGVRAEAMLGHSIGELVAAALAGVFSFRDAIRLVCLRGRFMQACPQGGMLGVECGEAELRPLLPPEVEVAVHNAPRWLAVSGPHAALEVLAGRLADAGVATHALRVSHGFHSAAMDGAAAQFERAFDGVALHAPERPFVSNVTGDWISDEQACSPAYWARQLRSAVRFHQGVSLLARTPERVFLEVGPGRSLARFAAAVCDALVIPAWPGPAANHFETTLAATGRLWLEGVEITWGELHAPERPARIPLPTYPFERTHCWVDVKPAPRAPVAVAAIPDVPPETVRMPARKPDVADWFYVPTWEERPPAIPSRKAGGRAILMLDAPASPCAALGPLLGQTVIVCRGERFRRIGADRYELPFEDRAAFEALFNELEQQGGMPAVLVHAGNVTCATAATAGSNTFMPAVLVHAGNVTAADPEVPDAERATGRYLELLALAQALGKSARPASIVLLANRLCRVDPTDRIAADKATILGPAKVIPLEYAGLHCRVVDVDDRALAAPASLVAEILDDSADRLVAWRDGRRLAETFRPAPLPVAETVPALREQGVYLITGGLGGVGLALADWLVRAVRARLVLVNRSPFPVRADWSRIAGSGGLPALPTSIPALEDAVARFTREFAIAGMEADPGLVPALEALCARCVLRYFRTVLDGEAQVSLGDLRRRLALEPRFSRMFELMTELLVAAGGRLEGDQLSLPALPPVDADAVARQHPEFRGLIGFVDHCTAAYPEALSGRVPAISVLYPDGTNALLDRMQRETVEYSRQRIHAHALRAFLNPLAEGRRLRVLEIGGGQGLLTRIIAPQLLDAGAHYHFTDVSRYFVQRFKEASPEFAAFEYGVFDITKEPGGQGLRPGSYDVIVGQDVVHATRDIAAVIANLRTLLAPSGCLCMLETVATGPWVDLCWGLADGWWHFEDAPLRERSPLMSADTWERLLAGAGFAHCCTLPTAPAERAHSDCALMIAQMAPAAQADVDSWSEEAGDDADVATRRRVRKLLALEALGGQVEVVSADVSDPAAVARVAHVARARFGVVNGVIHSALVLEDQLMQLKDAASARRVLAPKVQGSLVLAQAFDGPQLDFFAHCSSLAAPMGLYAQSDYCAATAFQDALAQSATGGRVLSVNWGIWRDTGFAMRMKLRDKAAAAAWVPGPGPVFSRLHRSGDGRVVFEGDLATTWMTGEHRLDGQSTLPGTGYLSLALEAFSPGRGTAVALRDVTFSELFRIGRGQPAPVRLLLEREGDGQAFKVAGLTEDGWVCHARGWIGNDAGPVAGGEPIGALKARFGFVAVAEAPAGAEAGLLHYGPVAVGPRWHRLLRWKAVRTYEALALLELPEAYADDLAAFPLHPALLDVATSLGMGSEALYLPLGYDSCRVLRPFTRRMWSHVTWAEGAESLRDTVAYRVTVYDAVGQVAFQCERYTVRRIDKDEPAQPRRLVAATPGLLDSLTFVPATPREPGAGEVEIAVRASGLNFLDVLSALGMGLRLPAGETGLGRECAGIVTRVGRDVSGFKPGDAVLALAANSFDDLATAPAACVRLKPEGMDFAEAAAFPVAFMTAHYALTHRARLARGETVLIHAAAGGVGLAAVQLARLAGATVIATAGTEEKRAWLRSLGVACVSDSRSDAFVSDVRQATNDRGVDVVLNSLGGDLMRASLSLLAPNGRFLELGKRDFAEDRQLGLSVFANGIAYFAINLSPEVPGYGQVFDEVLELLREGRISHLPRRAFPVEEVQAAFGWMAAGRHTGKVVVTRPGAAMGRRTRELLVFPDIDAPLDDPQLREGMSSAEGAEAFARALASRRPQVLVSTQDFPTLLRFNSPEKVRAAKEQAVATHAPAPAVPVDAPAPAPVVAGVPALVAEAWQKYLGVAQVGPDDNFFSLGGDSLIGIQVMAHLRKALKIDIPVGAFFEAPTLRGLAQKLEALVDKDKEPAEVAGAVIVPSAGGRFEPFPMTDVQQAYWVGRNAAFELGNVAAHGYFEVERADLDYERFAMVWQRLVRRHDLLRMVVCEDGRQRVLQDVPDYRPEVIDLRTCEAARVERSILDLRREMADQVLPSDRWPLFDIRVALLPGGPVRIHMSFDALIMDAWSSMILGREFAKLYRDPAAELPRLDITFRDFVLAEQADREAGRHAKDRQYWLDRLDNLPPAPDLPLAANPAELRSPRFGRRQASLPPATWGRLKQQSARAALTPSVVCLAAFAEVLARWSRHSRFTINLTLFNRPPLHPQINDIVGDFTSLTLLEIDASGLAPFEARAQGVQRQLWRDLDHRHFSGVQVLRELVRTGRRSSGAIMPVVFTSTLALESRNEERSPVIFDGEVVYGISQTPQVWLDHGIVEEDGGLSLNWNAVEELFPEGMLDDMFLAYQALLTRLADDAAAWATVAPLALPERQQAALADYNLTQSPLPAQRLEEGFFAAAPGLAGHAAVIAPDRSLDYGTLLQAANDLAGTLVAHQRLQPGELVGVLLDKGWAQVVAVLGILRAGGCYLPLDPQLPPERIAMMCEGVRLAVTTEQWRGKLPGAVHSIYLGEPLDTPADAPPPVTGDALAYVIYTSGSTGRPKGVAVRHFAAMNTVADINRRFGVGRSDRVFAISSLSFDLSVYDVFGMLSAGAGLVIPDTGAARDPAHWHALITEHRATIWNSVPALMELLVDYAERTGQPLPGSLRLVMLSGDWIPVNLPDRIRKLLPGVQVISLGGATEAAIWSIFHPVGAVDAAWTSIPYGRPLAAQEYHVLNDRMEPCPEWVTGELYIGGAGLADGYWRDPAKTAERFIVHEGRRLYRTGDLGRFRPEGWIEFQGRDDQQVKIQGYRIEIGEIEATLQQHPGVSRCAVKAVGPARGEKKLVGYHVPRANAPAVEAEALRQFAGRTLPAYMVPGRFVELAELPLTANGKVDYKALPEPQTVREQATGTATGAIGRRILEIAADLLKVPSVTAEDNLLDLGADSILMIRLANSIQGELGFRPGIADLYRMRSIGELLRQCEASTPPPPSAVPGDASALPLILDPDERRAFKEGQPGLRHFPGPVAGVALDQAPGATGRLSTRRSRRQFALRPIPLEAFGRWLGNLRRGTDDGKPRYLYPSAGGLYPVQTYVFAKAGRIAGLEEGLHYHDPAQHRLVTLAPGPVVPRTIFDPIVNQPIFDESAFCLFFVASMEAIQPIYGEHSARFAAIEAGLMAQTLDLDAPAAGLGLCHIGDLDFAAIRPHFKLGERHQWVLSLLGGALPDATPTPAGTSLERLVSRVSELSPEQLRALLAAKRQADGRQS